MHPSMRRLAVIILCLGILFGQAPCRAEPAVAEADYDAVAGYITAAMDRHNIPGVALAYARGGRILYSNGFGTAGRGRPVTADTPFYIGSQTKSFTALAIMQLVEQGQLALDVPVQTYIPWFRVADEDASRSITVRHLLQHSSGLSDSGYTSRLSPDATLEAAVRDLSRARLTAPVGTRMQYFNAGYSTLGLLIETASGQAYGDYIREHITAPLQMANTFSDLPEAEAAGLAQGYSQVFPFAVPRHQPFYRSDLPAGYIMSSANDLARFLQALANGGELDGARVLTPESVALLFTPNSAIDSTYGFGWYIGKYGDETRITHGGETERFHTAVLLLPETGQSLVFLVNANHLLKDLGEYNTLFWTVAGLLTGHPLPAEGRSSIVYGWGLLALWLVIVVMAGRKVARLPQWRAQMLTWSGRQRAVDIAKHLLGFALSVAAVYAVSLVVLGRGFSWRWFVGFLPDVAIIVATLVLDDAIQIVLKLAAMARTARG